MSVFVIELRKDTNELRKDNAELKKQTERLTRQLEDNHEGIQNLYTILKQLHNFWFPYSREWK